MKCASGSQAFLVWNALAKSFHVLVKAVESTTTATVNVLAIEQMGIGIVR